MSLPLISNWTSAFVRRRIAIAGLLLLPACLGAQAPGGPPPAAPTAKAAAPVDVTGYWVSIITEDWRYRMVTPAPGDYQSVPMTPEARKVADAWDPTKDEATGNQCKSYGAAAILRLPERLHIDWQDDQTLRVAVDAGSQTRLFHFGKWNAPAGAPSWQGESRAQWETQPRGAGNLPSEGGSLKVFTTHMRSGYLRKNGVPYSENAVLTEYFDLVRERSGDLWLVTTTVVDDPKYLQQPFVTSSQFKKQADASGWDPSPCSARW